MRFPLHSTKYLKGRCKVSISDAFFGVVETIVGAATLGGTIDTDSQERDHHGNTLDDYTRARDEGKDNPTSSSGGWW